MKIGGLQKLTLIDFPGRVACTVFLSGCNFRCPWCYSPELVLPDDIKKHPKIEEEVFFDFLDKRKGKLDGVVVCGGEPTISKESVDFVRKIKEKGFLVKLDTNGANLEVIKEMKEFLDYIAMDVKLPVERYKEVSEKTFDVKESIDFIKSCGVDYEFRTTVVPGIHKKEDIEKIAKTIKGAKRYYMQNFLPEKTIDENFLKNKSFSIEEMEIFRKTASPFVENCEIR